MIMRSAHGSELLTVADVMARYRLRDRRAARRAMDAAGSFKIGAGLFCAAVRPARAGATAAGRAPRRGCGAGDAR
jgi:hypothetical protein